MISTGWPPVDVALGGGLLCGALHEWFGLTHLPDGQRPAAPWSPPLCVLVHLAWRAIEASSSSLWTVWIGKRCFPYPGILVRDDGNDRRLLERSVFVDPRDTSSRLWTIDLALRSPVVGVVIADGSKFQMAATRRVQLVAKANRTCALLVRPPWEQGELSAAQSRWLIRWEPSTHNDAAFPVNPRWSVRLLRCKGVQPDQARGVWALEWDRATSTVGLSAPMANQPCYSQEAATTQRHRSA